MNARTYRKMWLNPLTFTPFLWAKLPLAAFAGLRVIKLDAGGAEVALPAGWKTQNPFKSTYFAAQAMAAEMSTGAPMLLYIEESGVKVSSLVTSLRATFTKKATQRAVFAFTDGPAMKAVIEEAVATGEARTFTARTVGTQDDGAKVAEFEIEWSFKRKK